MRLSIISGTAQVSRATRMFYAYLRRGGAAGVVGGIAFGLYTAFVINPLVAVAETFEHGHTASGHEVAPLAGATAKATSVAAGVLWGLLLGIAVFGVVYFFVEPLVPGNEGIKSYVMGAAGFLSLSGVPWLVLPPQPPGVQQALPTDTRLLLYAGMILTGVFVSGISILAWHRLDGIARLLGIVTPFGVLLAVTLVVSPGATANSTPAALIEAFRAIVIVGQLALWTLMAGVHAKLTQRATDSTNELVDDDELSPV